MPACNATESVLLTSLVFVLSHAVGAKSSTDHSVQVKGWTIDQSSEVAGTVHTQLSSAGMRTTLDRLGLIVISRAPAWNVQVYNESTKKYIDFPYSELKKRLTMGNRKLDVTSIKEFAPRRTSRTKKIQGLTTFEYYVEKMASGKKRDKVFDLWVAKDIEAPPPVHIIFNDLMHIPVSTLVPLRAFGPDKRNSGNLIKVLDTYKVSKSTIKPSVFQALGGYRKVKDEIALMMDESDLEMARGLFGDIDSSKDISKPAPGLK